MEAVQTKSMTAKSADVSLTECLVDFAYPTYRDRTLTHIWWYGLSGKPASGPYIIFPAMVLLVFAGAMLAPVATDISRSEFNR